MTVDQIAEILEREGLSYVTARRTAREILALPPAPVVPREPTKRLSVVEVVQTEAAIRDASINSARDDSF